MACAVAVAALDVLESERLVERSREMGAYFLEKLQWLKNPLIREVRGKGLFIAIELNTPARPYCEQLMKFGLLCKETHMTNIRLTPPLVISRAELDWAFEKIQQVLG